MSCIKWHIGILGDSPDACVTVTEALQMVVSVTEIPSYVVTASHVPAMAVKASEAARWTVGIMCKAGHERWLEVTPDEPAWLTEANGWSYDYEVSTNLTWTIE